MSAAGHVLSVDEFLEMPGMRCAVLGNPIEHSLSPQLHSAGYRALGLDMDYYRVEAGESRDIRRLLSESGDQVRGFSVTMPGKQAALELADLATNRAQEIGSANTLVPQGDGKWLADNTDVDGVARCLEHLYGGDTSALEGARAVIVGNGGTARPAVAALAAAGVTEVTVLARSERALNLQAVVETMGMEFSWARFEEADIAGTCADAAAVISTIPAHAAEELAEGLCSASGIVDVIYDPYPTPLISSATAKSIPHADGLRMLAGQAEEQFRLFTGHSAPEGLMLDTVLRAKGQA
ncbi:shikimate dehydrogenase [Corynebacterium jeikeium]|uniref:shikimate dehydrogenase n=1 Tax=Corynebacterium jeikeium TaxID=38289 RepID=UPI00088FA12D|nr:shikimate dehydrogenase [Corynebacterium jeikeium]SCX15130.1 Shikimate dehydrogenase [Corynebacterium jeikeium]